MGAYLSHPITKKISTDDKTEGISYGASCMQGWRVDQEVRRLCDVLFIVYLIFKGVLYS